MNEVDLHEIERYYQNLSTLIRLHGAEHMGRQYVVIRLARIEATGPIDYSDLQRILGRVVDLRTWYESWHREAEEAEELARRYADEGRSLSAADLYHRASACHHWGAYLAKIGSEQRAEGRAHRVRCYREAARLWKEPIEPFAMPYEGTEMPGYLHLAAGDGPAPCVIMVNGADSVKEEYHNWARQFVRRGMSVLTMDGPGQGEMLGRLPMRPDAWEEPMSAAIDALEASGRVDVTRIGIWGSQHGRIPRLAGDSLRTSDLVAISIGRLLRFPRLSLLGDHHAGERDGGSHGRLALRCSRLHRGALHAGRRGGEDPGSLHGHPRGPRRAGLGRGGRAHGRRAEGRVRDLRGRFPHVHELQRHAGPADVRLDGAEVVGVGMSK